jgi:hypothetical protein
VHSDEYGRLHAACVAMAEQSDLPDARARWLTLAQACLSLAKDLPDGSRRRKCLDNRTRPTAQSVHGAMTLRAA